MTPAEQEQFAALLERLVAEGSLPEAEFEKIPIAPTEVGLDVRRGQVFMSPDTTILDPGRVRAALAPDAASWLRELEVHLVIDSTNTRMMEAARIGSIDGLCWFAELQTSGRGRRGRSWISPFARNLTLSMGFALEGEPRDAGALSLVAGLAIADLIDGMGVRGVALKWPNDVLVGDAKVCGVLIELVAHRRPLECVIGIGLNLDMPARTRAVIGQQVAALGEHGVVARRDRVAAGLVTNLVRYVDEFKRIGFRGMRAAYDEVHSCHGRSCRILQVNDRFDGTVLGVTDQGELRMRGFDGERRFTGGEVSLRRRD